ncbi:hypothetical protein [Sinorhizobium meliloti]|uniref:hypothetical protein n=1 Tax=Rhizobium meliloti TaxID=382 RepID=UPI000FD81D0E|nr:hypothetical protein [Sinorhizobium meliloti]RVK93391.1 hypothetical protein CN152_23300 [Sinorhizobium meliloti]RVN47469.1 hypothetical protein CN113_12940 [Sinorhizobium meliloti]
MPKKMQPGDSVLARGEVIRLEEEGRYVRVRFPGAVPITIHVNAIEQVEKPPKARTRNLRDIPD